MVELLIRWSLRNRVLVVVLALAVSMTGAWLGSRMPIDVLPDLTAPTVTVITEGRTLSPQEMEAQVTIPIEGALNGATGVRRVRSGTALGLSVVWVEFDWSMPLAQARQIVGERLALVAGRLPDEAGQPKLAPASSIMGEVLFFSLVSEPHDDLALRTVAQTQVRRRLLTVNGVSQVSVLGGSLQQYQIILAPDRLQAYGLQAADVVRAIEGSNVNSSGGVLVDGTRELVVEGIGRARTAEELASTVVASRADRSVCVSDLGLVRVGPAARRGSGASAFRLPDGTARLEDAVILAVQKQPGVNTLELTSALDRELDEIAKSLPSGMSLRRDLFRQASFIERAVDNSLSALIEGAAMVVLVVLVFLASLRTSVVTLVVLPVSVLTTGVVLYFVGGLNTMTLGGLAIAIGALVDDAIIDVENIVRRLRENQALPTEQRRGVVDVIYAASLEVRASIVLATAIILLAFSPLFFLSGIEGRLLLPLGTAFCVSLGISLIVALTLTPALCAWALPDSKAITVARESRLVAALKRLYLPVLDWSLARPKPLIVIGLLGLAGAGFGLSRAGSGFLPEFNEGALVIGVVTEPGTSLEASMALAKRVDEALMRQPEVVALGRRTGRAEEDEHVQGVEASEIDLTLDMERAERVGRVRRSKEELLAAIRADLSAIPGLQTSIGQPIGHRIDHMLSGTRAGIAIKIYGTDLVALRDVATRVEATLQTVSGVVDVSSEQQSMVASMRIIANREGLARHGLRMEDTHNTILLATSGLKAGQILDGSDAWEIVVFHGDPAILSSEAIARARVQKPDGSWIPLSAVADVREDRTPNFISREGLERKFVISCNTQGRDLGSVLQDIRRAVDTVIAGRTDVRIEYGGQFESARSTGVRLLIVGSAVVVLVVMLLLWMFRSIRDTTLILANMPLALIGAVVGVHVSGGVLTVASMIGFITVFGIALRNGIMLVSHIRHLQEHEGVHDLHDAVRQAALERLAPILMTALAAGLALVPLALRHDEPGNEILSPMAIVILFGLLSSSLLNMLLVPSFYLLVGRPLTFSSHRLALGTVVACLVVCLPLSSCRNAAVQPDMNPAAKELETTLGLATSSGVPCSPNSDEAVVTALDGGFEIEEAMRLALTRSPSVQAALHGFGASQANLQQAAAFRNPQLALGWLLPEGGGRSQWTLDLLQPIADAWSRPLRVALAQLDQQQALIDLSAAAREAVCAARTAWWDAAQSQSRVYWTREQLLLAARRMESVAEELALGRTTLRQLDLARQMHSAAIRETGQAQLEYRQKMRALAQSVHWHGSLEEVELSPIPEVAVITDRAQELAVQACTFRLDLRQASVAVERAKAELELARSSRWSTLELGISAERPAESGSTLVGPAASLEIPLSNRQTAAVMAAEQRVLEQTALQEQVLAKAAFEIAGLLASHSELYAQIVDAESEQVPEQELLLQRMRAGLAAGDTTRNALLDTEATRLELLRLLDERRWSLIRLQMLLEEAVGAPLIR